MRYAKLINGLPKYFKNPVKLESPFIIDGVEHTGYLSTDREEILLKLGYKPVEFTELQAEEGYNYTQTWTETENAIVRVWEAVLDEAEEETPEERIAALEEALDLLLSGETEGE